MSFPFPRLWAAALLLPLLAACQRERRDLHPPAAEAKPDAVQLTPLQAGGEMKRSQASFPEGDNAYAIAQGQQLFTDFNCVTCHAHGGGDIGPPLDDVKWIYGSDPRQIYASIVEGRPNGMPSFRPRLTDAQVRQLVAYIRSMAGLSSRSAAPGREDHMKTASPPNSEDMRPPVDSSLPKSSERPQ